VKKGASRTADLTAAIRARHVMHDADLIFEDTLASQLVSPFWSFLLQRKLMNKIINSPLMPDMKGAESLVLCRAEFIERQLKRSINAGYRQYVIIAAGMDSFAYRYQGLDKSVCVYEVDHPATQAVKLERLQKNGVHSKVKTVYVAADLERTTLTDALLETDFNPKQKSFFSCAGLTYYLSETQVISLFADIGSLSAVGSELAFDYSDRTIELNSVQIKTRNKTRVFLKRRGEEIKSSLSSETLPREMSRIGYTLREEMGPKENHEYYFAKRPFDGLRSPSHNTVACYEKIIE